MARVLVAFEESQVVCEAFRNAGHEAYSCDLVDCSGGHPEWHIKGDALEAINCREFTTCDGVKHENEKWDLLVAHPPCTYLSNVATRSFSLKCTPAEKIIDRWEKRAKGAVLFMQVMLSNVEHIAVENPIGFMNGAYRKPDQIIQPYYFADSMDDIENYQQKTTCLWLKNLPLLERVNDFPKPEPVYIRECANGRKKKVYFEENHGKIGNQKHKGNDAAARSKTFPNVGREMARQWGNYLKRKEE